MQYNATKFVFLFVGLYSDAQAAFDFLLQREDIDRKKIIIFGRSLGGSVAIQLASQPDYARKAMCLIVENTFTNLPAIAKQLFEFRIMKALPWWFFKNQVMFILLFIKHGIGVRL